jgi:hypothetical protein
MGIDTDEKVKIFTVSVALSREQVRDCIGWGIVREEQDLTPEVLIQTCVLNYAPFPDSVWEIMATEQQVQETQDILDSVWPDE